MGKGKKTTVGYWYKPAFHAGLGTGPLDAYLEFRGGDKTAWAGRLTASGTISINAPNLWGGEKDQGGIVGDVDVMFGEPGQQVNPYLASAFGPQQSAWRGLATLVFKGGKYGAMNPYPQKASHKIEKIVAGWDNDECWYPEAAVIVIEPQDSQRHLMADEIALDAQLADRDAANGVTVVGFSKDDTCIVELPEGLTYRAWSRWPADDDPGAPTRPWWCRFEVTNDEGDVASFLGDSYVSEAAAFAGAQLSTPVAMTGSSTYRFWLTDDILMNRGGVSLRVWRLPGALRAMNPAHILYQSRTQSDMGKEPIENINDASFRAGADWFHAQGFGLCTSDSPSEESMEEFEQRICRVAGCSVSRSLDGQWHLDIANGEYELADLPILTDDDILEFQEQPTLQDSAVNSVSVKYFDPQKKEAIVTPPVQAPALIAEFGTNHLTIEYLEIPTARLALRTAQRELLARITPLRAFQLKTTRKPYAWRPNTYFRLQSPKRRIADMVCILGEKSSGKLRSGAMSITASQDVYSLPLTTYVSVEEGVDTRPSQVPIPVVYQRAFEAPYTEIVAQLPRAELEALPADVGFLMAVGADPATTRNFTLVVDDGAGFEDVADGNWTATALVVEGSDYDATDFTLSAGRRLIEVVPGMPALWGEEIVRVDAINVITGEVTFGRSCADSVPTKHLPGERVWFYGVDAAADLTEYTEGETLAARLLTNTASAQLAIDAATEMQVEIEGRCARPYPPAGVRINGQRYPEAVVGDVEVTAFHRDRVAQADQLVDQTMADIGPEPGTTYVVRNINAATQVETYFQDGITTFPHLVPAADLAVSNRLEVYSVRGGLESLQRVVIPFSVGAVLLAEDGEPTTDEADDPIIME